MCEECRASLQGRNKDRLLNVFHFKKPLPLAGFFYCHVEAVKSRPLKTGFVGAEKGGRAGKTNPVGSLESDLAARFFDLFLESFGFVFGNTFLDGLGGSLHQSLGVAKTQAGGVAHSLKHLDFG